MTDLRIAAQQALEACEQRLPLAWQAAIIDELNNLRAALAEAEPEPVAWMDRFGSVVVGKRPYETFTTPLYTTPPTRRPLTHPQIHELDWPDDVAFEDILWRLRTYWSSPAPSNARTGSEATMSKHTPGPWTLTADEFSHIVTDREGNEIHVGANKVDARLIAAAPELLKALIDILPLADFGASEQSPPYADDHLLLAAQAAIAKATGGSHE